MNERDIKKAVKKRYAQIAEQKISCCTPTHACGCSDSQDSRSAAIGYTDEQRQGIPAGASLGLGCGNPIASAKLVEGEVVLDLGCGAGIDCFLAADAVGEKGKVIGVDMTPEMIDRAKDTAKKGGTDNVEFRLGEIENLPVADGSVDVVISNCVINLSPNKPQVFREAFRVLRGGGRLIVSDIVLLKALPDAIRDSVDAYTACIAGAMLKAEYLTTIEAAGFQRVEVLRELLSGPPLNGSVASVTARAIRQVTT